MSAPGRPAPAGGPVQYGGRRFRPVGEPAGADASAVGRYHQDGDLVWAEFSGAAVRAGRLVGTRGPDGALDAAYCFLTASGEPVAGACRTTPEVLADGRLRLTEHWRRLDGSTGVSRIEEVGSCDC
ncbi:MAG: hypothetical protein ACJ73E_13235 [Mycobacteriales bacterium]